MKKLGQPQMPSLVAELSSPKTHGVHLLGSGSSMGTPSSCVLNEKTLKVSESSFDDGASSS
ncbi:UNVERIFIED_CONTAM: hypothetical protein Sindi_1304400, partial [Sesamum indicum]